MKHVYESRAKMGPRSDWMDFPSEKQLPKSACQDQFDRFTDRTIKNMLQQKLHLCNQVSENSSDHLSALSLSLSLSHSLSEQVIKQTKLQNSDYPDLCMWSQIMCWTWAM